MTIVDQLQFPLDDEGYFRRACPLCRREFKILLNDEELGHLRELSLDGFLVDDMDGQTSDELDTENPTDAVSVFCPYCGQSSPEDEWWTDEQSAFIRVHAENIMATLVNEHLIKPLNRQSRP